MKDGRAIFAMYLVRSSRFFVFLPDKGLASCVHSREHYRARQSCDEATLLQLKEAADLHS